MGIGKRLRELRHQAGLSGNALARQAGVAQSTVSEVESGRTVPSIRALQKLCMAMGISLGDFFSGTPGREPLSPSLQTLIRLASRLSEKDLQIVTLLVEAMLQQKKASSGLSAAAEDRFIYPETKQRDK